MTKASKIIAGLCFVGFIFLTRVPEEAETTRGITGLDILFTYSLLFWLALSFTMILYGVWQLFSPNLKLPSRFGHLLTVMLASPGIVYFIYEICTDA